MTTLVAILSSEWIAGCGAESIARENWCAFATVLTGTATTAIDEPVAPGSTARCLSKTSPGAPLSHPRIGKLPPWVRSMSLNFLDFRSSSDYHGGQFIKMMN